MDESVIDVPQEQSAAIVETVIPTPETVSQASEALTLAKISDASPEEIQNLEAHLDTLRAKAAAPQETIAPLEKTPAGQQTEDEPEPVENPTGESAPPAVEDVRVSERPRISHLSDQDKLNANLINLYTRKVDPETGENMTLEKASRIVLGLNTPQAEPEPEPEPEPAIEDIPGLPNYDVEQLTSRKAELEKFLDEQAEGEQLFTREIKDAQHELIKIEVALGNAEITKSVSETQKALTSRSQATFAAEKQSHWQDMQGAYADLKSEESPLYQQVADIAKLARLDPTHPLHRHANSADLIVHCTKLAAKRLGIAPRGAPAAAPAAPIAPVASEQPKPGPVSGSRAVTPAAPPPDTKARIAQSEQMLDDVLCGTGSYKVERAHGFVR